MARPRKQTYTLEMYLKKMKDGDIDNSADVQRNFVWKSEQINGLIRTVLTDDYIPPIILGEEDNSQLHIADGGQRSAALNLFRYGNYKITSSIEDSIITYNKKNKDDNGNTVWECIEFDIKNKTYEMLPPELQKGFNEYQLETVIHEHCDRKKISKYIKIYNQQVQMNVSQKAYTYIYNFAGYINKILESKFFVDCSNYTENEKIKGVTERVVMESVMCMFHMDKWKKTTKQIAQYLNDNASKEEFEKLNDNLHRLENIITDDTKDVFNSKNSFIWLALFDYFTSLGVEDIKFANFILEFKNGLRNKVVDGKLFDDVDNNKGTKDKKIISSKLYILKTLMNDFLHINKEDTKFVDCIQFVKENIEDVTDEDIELFDMVANDVSESVDIDSWIISDKNRPSYLAIVGHAIREDNDRLLNEWLPIYEKNNTFELNQEQSFLHMKNSFDKFIQERVGAA